MQELTSSPGVVAENACEQNSAEALPPAASASWSGPVCQPASHTHWQLGAVAAPCPPQFGAMAQPACAPTRPSASWFVTGMRYPSYHCNRLQGQRTEGGGGAAAGAAATGSGGAYTSTALAPDTLTAPAAACAMELSLHGPHSTLLLHAADISRSSAPGRLHCMLANMLA